MKYVTCQVCNTFYSNNNEFKLIQLLEEIRQKTIFAKNSIRSEDEMAFEVQNWSQLWLSENGQARIENVNKSILSRN